jgi:CHAD domain-containing protein
VLQLDSDTTHKLNRRLRKVTRSLGRVRELDVLLLLIDDLQKDGGHDAAALATVRDQVQRDRDRLQIGKDTPNVQRVVRGLERAAKGLEDGRAGSGGRAWRWALDARVARRATMLKRTILEAGAVYLPGRLHATRIVLKKLRYAVELSAESGRPIDPADLRALKRWQDLLGHLHDVEVLLDRVRQAQVARATDAVPGSGLDRLVAEIEATCRQLHARYIRQREVMIAVCERLAARASLSAARATARRAS